MSSDEIVFGWMVWHRELELEELAQFVGVEIYPDNHPVSTEHQWAQCPEGGTHELVPAKGPRSTFEGAYWPICEGEDTGRRKEK